MADMMMFPNTVEEFMEQYKIVDTEKIYTNGTELVPIFRMMQWFEHVSATDKNVGSTAQLGTNLAEVGTEERTEERAETHGACLDTISRQAAIDALKKDMASLDHIIKGMSANDVRLDAYVSQRNQVSYDIDTINNLLPAQPEELDTLIKALEAEHKKLREMQEAQSGPHWIPVTVINQNYIPELKDFPYGGVLFTYRTPKGKLLVREAWVERGRIIGKKMNGTPIAYQQKPEPWEGDAK